MLLIEAKLLFFFHSFQYSRVWKMFQVASCSSFLMAFYFSQLLDVWYCFTLISEDCWNIGCWDQALGCRKRGESPCSAINTTICAFFFFFWIIYDHIQHNTYVENNLWITFTKWVFPYPLLISFIPKKKHALYLVHQY